MRVNWFYTAFHNIVMRCVGENKNVPPAEVLAPWQVVQSKDGYKTKYNNTLTALATFEQFSINTLVYIDCLRKAMNNEVDFYECDDYYEVYRDDFNFLKKM